MKEVQSAAGELAVPHEVHAADDGVRLAFQRAVAHRRNPGCDARAVRFVARSDEARTWEERITSFSNGSGVATCMAGASTAFQ